MPGISSKRSPNDPALSNDVRRLPYVAVPLTCTPLSPSYDYC